MSKTPSKTDSSYKFKSREIATPNKDHHGLAKTVYSHLSNLHGLLLDWLKIREKGARVAKAIAALKLHECMNDYYPSQLKPLMESLLEVLDGLKNIIDALRILDCQFEALAKLEPTDEPLIFTWPVSKIAESVSEIFESLEKEYKLKIVITENVAHCRDEHLIELYVSAWEFEVHFKLQSYSFLFAEVGLSGFS